jgi:alpha-L-arabinofuranosidase
LSEPLESRTLLAVVTVDAGRVVREVNPHVIGVNLAWWDTNQNNARTVQMARDAGLNFFRFPGGSSSDEYHFADPPSYNGRGTAATFANFITSVGGQGVVTLNYGTGSPQEAAAWLAYLNADPGDTTPIGVGQQWNGTTSTWVQKDWKTAGYWAGLRAAAPLATNDGLNFLRIHRPAPFGFHYFEIGNELYGSWEVDHHGQGGDTGLPHDPATYAIFAKQFADYAAQIDPTISIGIDSGSVGTDTGWTARVLREGLARGFVPGFISDHLYMQAPGQENDATLLLRTVSNPNDTSTTDPKNWARRATGYRSLLKRNLGAAADRVELLATEYNSVYSNPGKQTTSLVNGLFAADSIGMLMQTEYNGANFWDLRNGWDTGNNNSASLYGWRQGGDYGMLGSASGPAPATGTYVPYPTYFAHQLASKMAQPSGTVVDARSDSTNLAAYAVRQADGRLDLLVINKNPTTDLTEEIRLQGFQAGAAAHVWQYGKAEDTAQSLTTDGSAALTSTDAALAPSGTGFSFTFPSYSMTVIELAPAPPAAVAGRAVFYNQSAFDGNDPTAGAADDAAVATDKAALLPGGVASFANMTSYTRGLNGVFVDVANLPPGAGPGTESFSFKTGTGGDPSAWAAAPTPSSVTVRRGAGVGGSDRITLAWAGGAVKNAWLQVTVLANAATGLAAPDVFYFGNLVGETGDAATPTRVSAADLAAVKREVNAVVGVAGRADFNRDGHVNALDLAAAKANVFQSLGAITAPAATAILSEPFNARRSGAYLLT